ncbi:MAG: monovalent cation:proton antiporter-2 (CPA2) family protein [Gammaproteobacteria bacterium]|nr:monovalent cation:proton antiporter-2 (CPA2) family protein [Gammaproteobacteria bacterium]CAJ2376920.1 MAG: Glutathione-regulated potassium-efflux system protein KefB [Arenicellales bacterium IbO2]MDA7962474.1 monovalent cation:proton antiporter-2 (CPA2) family protein [Gammaproteobacteria bacterium]MDA7970764.1 monovalent cation:proton antiporter-2 (CPA2) family protein [Gammaproteobacteria bacterium]MDA7995946.1 monovalent cation:proton antiporter-2 (CPA2) family protein [Gammaproteobacte
MHGSGLLFNFLVFLSAAVIVVPLFARIGLGSVLGYLVAGICIGPWGLGLIKNVSDILHFSEIGVVLLLFLIGLELAPRKLWPMRRAIFGIGGMQVLVTAALICAAGMLLGANWRIALIAGLGLALSSTAVALQILREKNLLSGQMGRTAFSILLFQDIAVVPILALVPLIGGAHLDGVSLYSVLGLLAAIAGTFTACHFLLRYVFFFVASTRLHDVFTALSLLLVAGIAALMDMLGVSMALGAFLAGVIMADSEYRHVIESDIEPFKGLLLGLFFISVGMSVDFGLLREHPLPIAALTLGLLALKGVVLCVIAALSGIRARQRGMFALVLAQGGEFGFVVFGFALAGGMMEADAANQLILAVALSMAVTPLLLFINEKWIEPRFFPQDAPAADGLDDAESPVIIIGFGRFGQVIGRMLMANKIMPTIIDNDPEQLERVRRFGYKSYYGDALRLNVLHSAGADRAKLIVLSLEDAEEINQSIDLLRREFPEAKIFARAYDRGHAMHLIDHQVDGYSRETFASALEMAEEVLIELGFSEWRARRLKEKFREFDIETLNRQVSVRHDEKALISIARSARGTLEETFAADDRGKSAREEE